MCVVYYTVRGGSGGGGHGGPIPPPFGTEQAQNAEVYRALSARSYSDAAHISLSITASCPANIKHSNCSYKETVLWQCLSTKADSERKRPYVESPELMSSCYKFCVFTVVSDGLRTTLTWSKFQNFPGGACPPDPLERYALYAHRNCTHIARAAWPHQRKKKILYVCPPPLLKTLDPPLKVTENIE